jgi:hypothetical protein
MNKFLESIPLSIASALPTAVIGAIASLAALIRGLDPSLLEARSAIFIPATAIFLFITNLGAALALSPLTYLLSLTGMLGGRIPEKLCMSLASIAGIAWIIVTASSAKSGNMFLPPLVYVAFAVPISAMVYNMASRA